MSRMRENDAESSRRMRAADRSRAPSVESFRAKMRMAVVKALSTSREARVSWRLLPR